MFSRPPPVAFSGRQMSASWTDVSSGLIPVGGNVWALAIDSEIMPLPELLAAVYFAASDPLSRRGSFRDQGLAQRQHRGPEICDYRKTQQVRLVGSSSATFRRGK